ncbi:MAG: hypothetical protein WCL44_01880 [bacterium]
MSKLHRMLTSEAESDDSQPAAQWYLKMPQGAVFGPVVISQLINWAVQGRIVVGNMVSSDNQATWVSAENVPELNMTWVGELRGAKRYGPFNLAAVPVLVQRGKLLRTATVQNCITGEMLSVSSVLRFGAAVCLGGDVARELPAQGVVEGPVAAATSAPAPADAKAPPAEVKLSVQEPGSEAKPLPVTAPHVVPVNQPGQSFAATGKPAAAAIAGDAAAAPDWKARESGSVAKIGELERTLKARTEAHAAVVEQAGIRESKLDARTSALEGELGRERTSTGTQAEAMRRSLEDRSKALETSASEVAALRDEVVRVGKLLEAERSHKATLETAAGEKHGLIKDIEQRLAAERRLHEDAARDAYAREDVFKGQITRLEKQLCEQKEAQAKHDADAKSLERTLSGQLDEMESKLTAAMEAHETEVSREKKIRTDLEEKVLGLERELAGRAGQAESEVSAMVAKVVVLEEALKRERNHAAARISAVESTMDANAKAYDALRKEMDVLRDDAGRTEKKLKEEHSRATALEVAAAGAQERLKDLEQKLAGEKKLSEDVAAMERAKMAEAAAQISKLERELQSQKNAYAELEARSHGRELQLGGQVAMLKSQQLGKAAGVESELAREQVTRAELEKRARNLEQERDTLAGRMETEASAMRRKIADLEKEIGRVESSAEKTNARKNDFTALMAKLERDLQEQKNAYAELEARSHGRELQLNGQLATLKSAQASDFAEYKAALQRERAAREEREKDLADERAAREEAVRKLHELQKQSTERQGGLEAELARERDAPAAEKEELVARASAMGERIMLLERDLGVSENVAASLRIEAAEARKALEASERTVKERDLVMAGLAAAASARAGLVQRFLAPRAQGSDPGWYVRGEGEDVYGPVVLPELWDWTCQYRIGPSHHVSQDKVTWLRADSIPALRMDWTCDLPDGTVLGPFNPFAVQELITAGEVGPQSEMVNRLTGEKITAGELLKAIEDGAALAGKLPDPAAQEWKKRYAAVEERSQQLGEDAARERAGQVSRLQVEADAIGSRLKALETELENEREAAGSAKALAAMQIRDLNKKLQKLEQEFAGTKTAHARLKQDAERTWTDLDSVRVEFAQCLMAPGDDNGPGWYFKGEDGSVYGPASLPDLWNWACQLRIGPAHLVSQDQQTWIAAETLSALRMDWVCELTDGAALGPLNLFAYRELVACGEVTLESILTNRLTGEKRTVGCVLKATEDGAALRMVLSEQLAQDLKQRCAAAEDRCMCMEAEAADRKAMACQPAARPAPESTEAAAAPIASPPPKRLRERLVAAVEAARTAGTPS